MSNIHENVWNIILNNTEPRNFRRNFCRRDKNLKVGDRVVMRTYQNQGNLESSLLSSFKITEIRKNKATLDFKGKPLVSNITHLLVL